MEAEIAKMPADKQEMAKLGTSFIDQVDMTMELKSGGAASMKSTMPNILDPKAAPKTEDDTGTWKKDGDTITITGPKGDKDSFTCTKSGSKLTCKEPNSKDNFSMIFTKS